MNDDKDYLDLSGIPEHLQGFEILKHKANWRLNEALQAQGIDFPASALFVNSVNAPNEQVVTHSASLVILLVEAVQNNEHPVIRGETSGVFGVAHSFADEHRIDGKYASIETFATIASDVYEQLTA
ncbi:hypothetical protein OSW16_22770 [Pseudomonas putida]|uniref:hypothetical protein n=1 Tax=Pseudomonas putida TaxID=303 RepID=UPI00226DF1CE|nr:hypothetical protein [Pseudomonas putida]WAB97329.1 hypothetical protein OSW16_22770 [Pseudomonas putida]